MPNWGLYGSFVGVTTLSECNLERLRWGNREKGCLTISQSPGGSFDGLCLSLCFTEMLDMTDGYHMGENVVADL